MTNDIPPVEFSIIGLDSNSFYLVSRERGEWHGRCPCAGCRSDPHNTDRFRIFTHREFPGWWASCRKCGFNNWIDELNPAIKRELSPQEKIEWAKRQKEYEEKQRQSDEEHRARQREKLKYFTNGDLIKELHDRMSDFQRQLWRDQGIPDSLQDYYKLGVALNKTFRGRGGDITTDAMTIPYYHYNPDGLDWIFKIMQYRMINPLNPKDRYRFASDLDPTWFDTCPDLPIPDRVIFSEGSKKGINIFKIMPDKYRDRVKVIGRPNNKMTVGMKDIMSKCDRGYILPDPDKESIEAAQIMCRDIGNKKLSLLLLPFKIDDGINDGSIDWRGLEIALRHSRTA